VQRAAEFSEKLVRGQRDSRTADIEPGVLADGIKLNKRGR
jgi:hypothetical protein